MISKLKSSKFFALILQHKIISIIISLLLLSIVIALPIILSKNNTAHYEVLFDSNGGSMAKNELIEDGDIIQRPENPTKAGFDFLGWSYNGEIYDFKKPISSDMVLTALWKNNGTLEIINVYFDSDGGSLVNSVEVGKGNSITKPLDPTKYGYSFDGWYLKNEKFDFNTKINESLVLNAKWKQVSEPKKNDNSNSSNNNTENSQSNNNNSNNNNINITWDDISGIWYYTGTDDIYVNMYKEKVSDGNEWLCISGTRVDTNHNSYNAGYNIGGSGGCVTRDLNSFVYYYGMSLSNQQLKMTSAGKALIFYRSKNYPNHVISDLEQLYNNLDGTWYLDGYGTDVYIKFTKGIRYDEKVLFYDQHNYCGSTASIYSTSCGSVGYFSYYGLNSEYELAYYGYSYSNNSIYVNKNGNNYKFSKTPTETAVSGIKLDRSNSTVEIGTWLTLKASFTPSNATNKKIIWSSSNPAIASVNSSGEVYAISARTAIITAKTEDGNYTDQCNITVPAINVQSITLNKNSLTMNLNVEEILTASITPSNASNKNIIWSSSDSTIASVASNGKVTGKSVGTAIITAKTEDGSYEANCQVTITYPPLIADGSIGLAIIHNGYTIVSGVQVSASASGGAGWYKYYIKLYYNDNLIGESTDPNSSTLFVNQTTNGQYRAEITVKDKVNTEKSKTIITTISIN